MKGSFTGAQADRKGYFELAHGGTLFLDEVGELPTELQPKLLRVLEDGRVTRLGSVDERAVTVRVIAASNVDFKTRIQDGQFREDLYFRLVKFTVDAPPLRGRREDIPLLAQHFLEVYAAEMSMDAPPIAEGAVQSLTQYPFPGNVRELKNIIERPIIESGGSAIGTEHLHFFYSTDPTQASSNTGQQASTEDSRHGSSASDEQRIMDHVSARGSINNTECRELLNVERNRASYLLKKLHGSGLLECIGQGRWATYRISDTN